LGKVPRVALLAVKITSRLVYGKIMLRPGQMGGLYESERNVILPFEGYFAGWISFTSVMY